MYDIIQYRLDENWSRKMAAKRNWADEAFVTLMPIICGFLVIGGLVIGLM